MSGLAATANALRRVRVRVGTWSNAVGADHEDALARLRKALTSLDGWLVHANRAGTELQRAGFAPKPVPQTLRPFSVGDRVRLTRAGARRWAAMAGAGHRLHLRSDLHVAGIEGSSVAVSDEAGTPLAVVNRRHLELAG
jgi:hypothetical protein